MSAPAPTETPVAAPVEAVPDGTAIQPPPAAAADNVAAAGAVTAAAAVVTAGAPAVAAAVVRAGPVVNEKDLKEKALQVTGNRSYYFVFQVNQTPKPKLQISENQIPE